MVLDTANVNGYLTQMENRVIGSNQRELRRFPRIDKRSKRRLRSVLIAGSNMVGQKNSESGFSTMLIELCRLCFKNKITKSQSIELAMMLGTSCLWGRKVYSFSGMLGMREHIWRDQTLMDPVDRITTNFIRSLSKSSVYQYPFRHWVLANSLPLEVLESIIRISVEPPSTEALVGTQRSEFEGRFFF